MAESGDEKPFHLMLADYGYDVWIGNNRGTEYSQGHTEYDAAGESAEQYWDFTWADMSKDDKANVEMIKERTNLNKIHYIGLSQGNTQMHYALAHDATWYKDNLHRAVQLAPCFVSQISESVLTSYDDTIASFRENGIFALNGPNWVETYDQICNIYGQKTCDSVADEMEGKQPVSVKSEQHWIQNNLVDGFNEFQDEWTSGVTKSAPIDVSKIDYVPMSFFIATEDELCTYDDAYKYIAKMDKADKTVYELVGKGHDFFNHPARDGYFMTRLLKELSK